MKSKTVVDEVISFIMGMGDEELASFTVEKIAELFKIDRFKLSRKFKILLGETLAEYLIREKMIRSAFILGSQSDITLSQLAERMGFCNAQYFSRAFKKCFGLTPGRYRACKRLRSGLKDRRAGPDTQRRKTAPKVLHRVERRKGPTDRRSGENERRSTLRDYLKNIKTPEKKN